MVDPAALAAWLLTYAVHSTCLLAAAGALAAWLRAPAYKDALWKCAVGFVIIIAMSLFGVGPGEQHELAQAGSAHTASAGGR